MTQLVEPGERTRAVAMWDFSWLERRGPGGGYEDWGAALDGLVERGYDTVRIDAYPHVLGAGADSVEVLPAWTEHDWGSPVPVRVDPRRDLPAFLRLVRDRGLRVSLSTWFREDADDLRGAIREPERLGEIWVTTLRLLEAEGLLDLVWFVDLCNEWPQPKWARFLYDRERAPEFGRDSWTVREWTRRALAVVRADYPDLPLCFSFAGRFTDPPEDLAGYDLLEPHVWMSEAPASDFSARIGYDLGQANFDPREYRVLSRSARAEYTADRDRWTAVLRHHVDDVARWAERARLPLVTSECWSLVCWKDGPGLEWDWIKELCATGVEAALGHGGWAGVATSNFCGPQYPGMWDDVAWHRRLTDRIHDTAYRGTSDETPVTAV